MIDKAKLEFKEEVYGCTDWRGYWVASFGGGRLCISLNVKGEYHVAYWDVQEKENIYIGKVTSFEVAVVMAEKFYSSFIVVQGLITRLKDKLKFIRDGVNKLL